MTYNEYANKRTGRTTRMLEAAIAASKAGHAVYVVTHTENHTKVLRSMLGAINNAFVSRINFETPEMLGNFDIETCALRRAHPNCKVFVDHSLIEARYRALLDHLHAYDLTGEQALENWLK